MMNADPRHCRTLFRACCSAVLAVLLAAPFGSVAQAQVPPVGSDIGNPAVFGRLFYSVCVAAPTLSEALALMDGVGMQGNPETGTYFHQQFNMSMNPSGELCSIVFSAEDEAGTSEAFRQSVAQVDVAIADAIEIVRVSQTEALYLRAGIAGQWP